MWSIQLFYRENPEWIWAEVQDKNGRWRVAKFFIESDAEETARLLRALITDKDFEGSVVTASPDF